MRHIPGPHLRYEAWKSTLETLHLWLQIVGKIQLVQSPWVNHSWHAALQITSRGISTRALAHGTKTFQIELDCIDHCVAIRVSDGAQRRLPLRPQSTATFYRTLMVQLAELGVPVTISTLPNELPTPIPFERDEKCMATMTPSMSLVIGAYSHGRRASSSSSERASSVSAALCTTSGAAPILQ